MTTLDDVADRLNRMVKIALDTGEAATIEEAERIFAAYRVQICVAADVAGSVVLQAAVLTAVGCAVPSFLGGVTVIGAAGPLSVRLPGFTEMDAAVRAMGAKISATASADTPTIVIGDAPTSAVDPLAIRATYSHWAGGVVPVSQPRLDERGVFTPAGVLAGALAVSEVFQRVRGGNPMACRRRVGIDLWNPSGDWTRASESVGLELLPSAAWLVGLGNLGQAYLWTLGLLPYAEAGPKLVLQDTDSLAASNLSTSLLTTAGNLKQRKTRAMAAWCEARGFTASILERPFAADFRRHQEEPPVALIGVDNPLARQSIEEVGFDRVIEAGLGKGPQDFLGLDVHTFPASVPARDIWTVAAKTEQSIDAPAYAKLLEQTNDRCGTVRLAGRSVGAPFVGAVAGALVVSELIRLTMGGPRYELISCHLRDLAHKSVFSGAPWPAFNPGSIDLAT